MSALAKICLNRGVKVSGSDKVKNHITEELEHLGAIIFYKHQKKNVAGADLVVYTCAVGENNAEVMQAKQIGKVVLERAEFLGEIAKEFENVVAVSGSHGKTTVCGMIQNIFEDAGKSPTLIVGGETMHGNLVIGKKEFLIVEACEYREHFLKLTPTEAIVLNVDYDHPDFFKSSRDYELAFEKFAGRCTRKVFVNEKCSILIDGNKVTFGDGGDFFAKHIVQRDNRIFFDVYKQGGFFEKITLNLIGSYNISNALCAVAVADYFGISKVFIKNGIERFENLKRRYEYMGKFGNNIVITDYAHHPTQIENCILATRETYHKKILVVFEPHTYTRTKFLFGDFVKSLCLADDVIILPTYSAREKSKRGGTSRDLFEALKMSKNDVWFVRSYKKCLKEFERFDDHIILILGAGRIINLAETIKKEYLRKTLD